MPVWKITKIKTLLSANFDVLVFLQSAHIQSLTLNFYNTHRNKSDFSTFKTELQNSLLSNINGNSDNNEKKLKHPGGNI